VNIEKMKLRLIPDVKNQGPVRAAFLRGGDPVRWLSVLEQWRVPSNRLECYVVPVSRASIDAGGLFVIWDPATNVELSELAAPYVQLADGLFIPAFSSLFPSTTRRELDQLTVYDRQLMHPVLGFIGFNTSDRINLSSLLELPAPENIQWDMGRKGITDLVKLSSIQLDLPPGVDVIKDLGNDIDRQSLKDIPLSPKTGEGSGVGDQLIQKAMDWARNLRDKNKGSENQGQGLGALAGRFGGWMTEQLEALERRRQEEIDRLMNLLDRDPEEALRYSIPLDGKYRGRGQAPPSSRLNRRSWIDFALGGLGGGLAVDSWDLGDRYYELRKKYREMASRLMQEGKFRKAAYVYAHLLSDYHAAANALEQGKFYREAAAVYKDHLNNPSKAAECLENGGLLLEAIEIYIELKRNLKVGDLFVKLDRWEQAQEFYEKVIQEKLKEFDYLTASALCAKKMNDRSRAQRILLEGWKKNYAGEACLKRYFEGVASEDVNELPAQIQEVHQHHTKYGQSEALINVLIFVVGKYRKEEVVHTSRELAFQLIAQEYSDRSKDAILNRLPLFWKNDRLIRSDVSRFIHRQTKRGKEGPKNGNERFELISTHSLDGHLQWLDAINHRGNLLLLARKNNQLYLVRNDWKGHSEYFSWILSSEEVINDIAFAHHADTADSLIIGVPPQISLDAKRLPDNRVFSETLIAGGTDTVPVSTIGITSRGDAKVDALIRENGDFIIQRYQSDLLMDTIDLKRRGITDEVFKGQTGFQYRDGDYIFILDKELVRYSESMRQVQTRILPQRPIHIERHPSSTFKLVAIAFPNSVDTFLMARTGFSRIAAPICVNKEVKRMGFVGKDRLVVALQQEARVYRIQKKKNALDPIRLEGTFPIGDAPMKILATPKRNEVAFVSKYGHLDIYQI
jgi:tetratricopeptide (TPR) repeat protein